VLSNRYVVAATERTGCVRARAFYLEFIQDARFNQQNGLNSEGEHVVVYRRRTA
jgi:hypothetical protein